jgi:hypothetical protein
LDLSQASPAPKQRNLSKLRDAGGLKDNGKPTQSKTDYSGSLGIHQKK